MQTSQSEGLIKRVSIDFHIHLNKADTLHFSAWNMNLQVVVFIQYTKYFVRSAQTSEITSLLYVLVPVLCW